MTNEQIATIERQIRVLRSSAFDGTTEEQNQTTARIICLKALLAPVWAERPQQENSYARVMWM